MKIEKTFSVQAPQSAVWAFITDPQLVAPCIPGCESAERVDDTHFRAKVALAIGPIKTSFRVEIEQTEAQPPERAVYQFKGDEGSQGSRVKAVTTLALRSLGPATTEVHYVSDVSIVGRLGKFGAGMVQKKADSIGDEFVATLSERLTSTATPAAGEQGAAAEGAAARESARAAPSYWWLAGLATAAGVAWWLATH